MTAQEVELTSSLSDGGTLDLFLRHPDEDGRIEAEAALFKWGANFVDHPRTTEPPFIEGEVVVEGVNVAVYAGPLYVLSALDMPLHRLDGIERAVLHISRTPAGSGAKEDTPVLAASLPLTIRTGRSS